MYVGNVFILWQFALRDISNLYAIDKNVFSSRYYVGFYIMFYIYMCGVCMFVYIYMYMCVCFCACVCVCLSLSLYVRMCYLKHSNTNSGV